MDLNWIEADGGYALALDDGKLLCRNKKGKQLASVPAKVKKTDTYEQLLALRDWLRDHKQSCRDEVDKWMQRSLPVPRELLQQVWADPCWREQIENAVVHPLGEPDAAGFLKGADAQGLGVVDLDGESNLITEQTVVFPHPILLDELDDWRELAADLELGQGIAQLHREVWEKPGTLPKEDFVDSYADGKFAMLRHVLGKCRSLGYKVTGGFAVCPVWEDGRMCEARFWIGADDPESEAWTGRLIWVDKDQKSMKLADVGPVAFSEGHRMAASIYAARVVEKDEEAA